MVDIDHFKQINDNYGHETGDIVLTEVAATVKTALRASDILARYGGEEFVAFMPNVKQDAIIEVSERVRKSVEHSSPRNVAVTVSIGVAATVFKTDPQEELNELMRVADLNLYRAKEQGRNRVVF